MDYNIRTIKSLKTLMVLLDRVSEKVKNKIKWQEVRFLVSYYEL